MRIKKLYIRDFGIFNNQTLDEIGPGLVLVGGLNRAGKTTFLELLRYIAFGFPRKKGFIPAREKHEIEAMVSLDDRDEMNIHLQGFAEPLVNILKGNNDVASASEIYNGLDPFTYQQLFTITLDELQANSSNDVDKERLQSILLGAGLQEFVLLPQLEDFFYREAEKIGGKNGDPNVRDFKPYFKEIEEGLNIRMAASKQVNKYKNKQDELSDINEKIVVFNNKREELQREINRLDILKNNYQSYDKIIELESKLATKEARGYLNREFYPDKAKDLLERYNKKEEQMANHQVYLKEKLAIDDINNFKAKCLKYKDKINIIKQKLSGIKENIRYYHEMERNISNEEDNLQLALTKVNEEWKDLEKLYNIKTDHIELVGLQRFIDKYNKISATVEMEKEKLMEYEERKKYLQESLSSLEVREPKKRLRFYYLSSFACIFLGIGLSFINIYLGMLGLAGFLGLVIYLLYKFALEKGYLTYREKSISELSNLEHQIEISEKKVKNFGGMLAPLEKELNRYRVSLGLTIDSPPELIKDYFRDVQQCKEKLISIEQKKKQLEDEYAKIDRELRDLLGILNEFPEVLPLEKIDDDIELDLQDDILFSMLEEMLEYTDNVSKLAVYDNEVASLRNELIELYRLSELKLTEENPEIAINLERYIEHSRRKQKYQEIYDEKEQLIQQIKAVLNTELVRNAMRDFPDPDDEDVDKELDELYANFIYLYEMFLSLDSVESKYYNSCSQLDDLKSELKGLEENKQLVKKELEDLATEDKLKHGTNLINQARQELSYLAEDYAVNKTAAYILKKVRETFIQQTKDKLLTGASKYFRKITGGEYKAILPTEKIMKGDFQALLRDGTIQDSTAQLSRGTNEQLFLAIRISRIKEIEPALPVIVDDSFVNFDHYHLAETMELIGELARTHQVFILTCHPNIIEICNDNDNTIQYWRLEKGQFSKTDKKDLVNYLSVNKSII